METEKKIKKINKAAVKAFSYKKEWDKVTITAKREVKHLQEAFKMGIE